MNLINQASPIGIGKRLLGDGQPCYVIAEIGNNHNGDFDRAIALDRTMSFAYRDRGQARAARKEYFF